MEAQQGFPFKPQPMIMVAYEVDCTNIADLNDPSTLKLLGFFYFRISMCLGRFGITKTRASHLAASRPITNLWEYRVSSVEALASSCTEKSQNLILWKWSDIPHNTVRVIDDFGRLSQPKD